MRLREAEQWIERTWEASGERQQGRTDCLIMASSQFDLTAAPLTRAEKETQTEAERLTTQIERALAAVAVRSRTDIEELEACADRLERAARDLSVALRELARERRTARDEAQ
ncbi:MAG TPA: hypothetical protein VGO69_10555 [Pyrinomonadaceae bacterium]|nr:hypothetical protein [Pyrinomonadaceae bacterium]